MVVSDLAERIHLSHTFLSGEMSKQLQNLFVMTEIKAQSAEKLVEDIDMLTENM